MNPKPEEQHSKRIIPFQNHRRGTYTLEQRLVENPVTDCHKAYQNYA